MRDLLKVLGAAILGGQDWVLFILRILVAITGASGLLYAQRLLDNLVPRTTKFMW